MDETEAELAELQHLIDASFARASDHLTSIMEPQRRLTARRLVAELPSPAVLNLATVTAAGQPRLSAVDGHFIHGHWYFTTTRDSPKARQFAARPAISVSYTPRDGYGVFAHGRAVPLDGADKEMLRRHYERTYGSDPEQWGRIAYVRVEADWLVGFAMTEAELAEIEAAAEARRAAQSATM